MVQEGLKDIYSLFIEKINSVFNQTIKKILENQKFQNANAYFFKDFPFFYFCVKFYSFNLFELSEFDNNQFEDLKTEKFAFQNNYKLLGLKSNSDAKAVININLLKNKYVEKFSSACEENFSRTFNLIKLFVKNFDTNFFNKILIKETIANDNITLYLINYIKQMSWAFIDLSEEFGLSADNAIILESDFFLFELAKIFSNKLNINFFEKIKQNLEELHKEIEAFDFTNKNENDYKKINNETADDKNAYINNNNNNIIDGSVSANDKKHINLLVFKYFYYLNILNKMNDILLNFQTSNIRFLITDSLKDSTENALNYYLQLIFNGILKRLMKDLRFILINKDFASL